MTGPRFLLVPIVVTLLLAGCTSTSGAESAVSPDSSSSAPSLAPSSVPSAATSTSTKSSTPTEEPLAGVDPRLTTEGFGDLRLGQKVGADSEVAAFNEDACEGGGGITVLPDIGAEVDVSIVTMDRTMNSEIVAITLYTDAFATKSGIRVGDTLHDLETTYGDELEDASYERSPEGLYDVTGNAGRVIFQLVDGEIAAIGLVTVGPGHISLIGTDGNSPCGVA